MTFPFHIPDPSDSSHKIVELLGRSDVEWDGVKNAYAYTDKAEYESVKNERKRLESLVLEKSKSMQNSDYEKMYDYLSKYKRAEKMGIDLKKDISKSSLIGVGIHFHTSLANLYKIYKSVFGLDYDYYKKIRQDELNDYLNQVNPEYKIDWVNSSVVEKHPKVYKLSDPVTYDDDGNIIPLSERFNFEKQDIRYSMGRKWKPQLTESEWVTVNSIVNNYAGEDYNDTKRYALKTEKGHTVFVLYSTSDDTPTLLFANSGNDAITAKYTADYYRGRYNGQERTVQNIGGKIGSGGVLFRSGTSDSGVIERGRTTNNDRVASILRARRDDSDGRRNHQRNNDNIRRYGRPKQFAALINALTDSKTRFSQPTFSPGEEPRARDGNIPRKVDGRNVYQTVNTVTEAEATPDELVPTIRDMVDCEAAGKRGLTFVRLYSTL